MQIRVRMRMRFGCLIIGAALCATAAAQGDYPNRALRFIVPHTPGGLGDTFARSLADFLAERLGQPVVVDNRPGANQAIGAEAAARSPGDGYTIFLGTQESLVQNRFARKKLPYEPTTDFTPITLLFSTPQFLVTHPSVPAQSVPELIALIRAKPGKLSYASIGVGSAHHLAATIFSSRQGLELVHVPYKGSAPAMLDVLSGRVDMIFQGGGSAFPAVSAGKLRALASTGLKRASATPDLPTMSEFDMPNFEVESWFALFGPAGVPQPIVQRLNREAVAMVRADATRARFVAQGVELIPSTPEELAGRLRADLPVWARIMRDAGIQPE